MKNTLTYLFVLISNVLFAQVDFGKQYASAKELFQNEKYNLAMESFKPLITYDQKNPFVEYASFYYAISAYRQGYAAVAKDMLNQIKKLYPEWEKNIDVNYWLARIHFDNGDYFQGLRLLAGINDKKIERDIEDLKIAYLKDVADLETLRMMHEDYPKDRIIARYLALDLSRNLTTDENRQQLEELIKKFDLVRKNFLPEVPKTFHKKRYAVSLMLPFGVAYLEPTPGKKRNQVILDFYEGMKLAIDTLSKKGINISLRAYDTERNVDKMKSLFETEELINTDVIIGPLFPEVNAVAQDFSMRHKINIINPFSNISETTGGNPYAFLFQPSAEVLGQKAAAYIAAHAKGKESMVFYGTGKKDSVLAANFVKTAFEKGINVILAEQVNNKETKKISDILSTPTEFDEFKYPSEFTLKKDSIQSIFVASDDPLIYTKVVGAVEMRGDSVLVVGSENWLDDNTIDFDKFESLRIVMQSPNYNKTKSKQFQNFQKAFLKIHGRLPSNIAEVGYELMMFVGHQLKNNGVYFQESFNSEKILPGYLGEGFDYRASRSNQIVPFTTIKKGEHVLIEKR